MAKRELKKANIEEPVVETADAVEEVATEIVEEKIEEPVVKTKSTCEGVVCNCSHLNIRKKANKDADVILIVDSGSKLTIDLNKSNDEWLRVTAADGTKGYCMKNYVKIDQ